ncbi:MAG: TIGR03621 family F420-dependent LLM class oxidoreductase [Actinomycetota bacterium]|nr:TIGR03621 family F420-dependent LLM class oxidoreductase [Actinomycetota bacterium]
MTATPRPFRFLVQSYAATSPDDWREQARRAEAHGYESFHLADHYIGPGPALASTGHPVQVLAAIPAMAVAAEATSTIRIGCRVLCIDYHQPVVLAKELATIGWFAGGRLDIGLGAGWLGAEYEAMGIPFDRAGIRIDRLAETIELVRAFCAGGALDIQGKHVYATGFDAIPVPPEAPRIMVGGGAPRVLRLAGSTADTVSINFDNRAGRIGPEGLASGTAEGTAEKIGWIREGAGDRFDEVELEIAAYFTFVTDDRDGTLNAMAPMFGLSPDQFAEHPHALVGGIDEIVDILVERRERYGISSVTVGGDVMDAFAPVVARLAGT